MLSSITKVKTHGGISGSGNDSELTQILTSVDAWIKSELARQIEKTAYTAEIHDGDREFPYLQLSDFPVVEAEMTLLQYNAGTHASPAWTNIDSDDYEFYADSGMIYFYKQFDGKRNIKITYQAGYSAVPTPLELLANRLTLKIFERRKAEGIGSQGFEGVNLSFASLLDDVDKMTLKNYKRYILV